VATPPKILDYAVMTEPFPLQASPGKGTVKPAKLTFVGSNPDPEEPITIEKITIRLPIGSKATDLTNVVPPDPVAPENWEYAGLSKGAGVVDFRFKPLAGHKDVGEQGLEFVFDGVNVNTQPGIFRVEIEQVNPDEEPAATLEVAKFPYGWGEVSFRVKPANISIGEHTTLKWSGPVGAEYTIEYSEGRKKIRIPKQGQPKLGNDGTYPGDKDPPLKPQATTTFSLNVSMNNERYEAQEQRTVTVNYPPPSIEYFRPRGCQTSECVLGAHEITLEWSILNSEPSRWQLTQEWPELSDIPAQVIPVVWTKNFILLRPTQRLTRYTLMVKDKHTELTAIVNATLAPPVPIGTVVPYGALLANNLPTGWLYCNGDEYVKDRYPQLYPIIKDVYGKSADPAKGKLPDFRGYFVRGYDDNRGIDSGRKMGSVQDDALKKHTHGQKVTANSGKGSAIREDFKGDVANLGEYDQGVQTFEAGTANESRPKNIATYFVIYAGQYMPEVPKSKQTALKSAAKSKKAATKKGSRGGR
jgi:microcystin-dependent protein